MSIYKNEYLQEIMNKVLKYIQHGSNIKSSKNLFKKYQLKLRK